VDTVRADDDVGLDYGSIRERHVGLAPILLEARATVPRVYDVRWKCTGQELDKIGAMHSECSVPTGRVRHLDWCNRRPVVAEIVRTRTNPRSPFFDGWTQSDPLQLAYAVRRQEYPGPDLAESRGLLVDQYPDTMCGQSVRSEQAAYSTADDYNFELRLHSR
jgi:hypothetical protein